MKYNIKYIILLFSVLLLVDQVSAVQVKIIPSSETVTQGEIFNLNVSIDPNGTAIAGTQLKIEFNNSMLNVNNINEGDLFKQNGTSTLFYKNIINNSLVTEINAYGAILGPFNVSTPGTFIIINVTAIGSTGQAQINLSNVKISDPGGNYTPINFLNGSVNITAISPDITPPASVDNLQNISYAREFINWTWTDPQDQDLAKVMVYLDGHYQKDVLKGVQYFNAIVAPGTYTIGTRTVDINGNINSTIATHTASTILPIIRFINGTVMDSFTKIGIQGVTVSTNASISTTTNASGFYSLAITAGAYDLTGTFAPSYYTNSTTVLTTLSTSVVQDIELTKKPIGMITGSVRNV
jgi:hypothetical protein